MSHESLANTLSLNTNGLPLILQQPLAHRARSPVVFLSDYNFDGSDSVIGGVSAYDTWSSLPEGNQSMSFQAQLHLEGVAELAGAVDFEDDFSAVNSPTGS
jgi:hypothetical protein